MLQTIDYLDEILERQHRAAAEMAPEFYASELLEALGYRPVVDMANLLIG